MFPLFTLLYISLLLCLSIIFSLVSLFFAFQLFDLVFFSEPQSGGQSPKDGPRGRRGPGGSGRAGRLGSSPTPFEEGTVTNEKS